MARPCDGKLEGLIQISERDEKIKQAFDYVDRNIEGMIEELKLACSKRSVAGDDEGLEATRRCIEAKIEAMGLTPVRHDVRDGNALITAKAGPGDAKLLLYNHYDVVEPGLASNWRIPDPFEPRMLDGVLFGRGVSDNKGPLYSRLHAVQAVLETAGEMPVGVKFLFEGDEEISSPSMSRFAGSHPEAFREMIDAEVCVWENGRNDSAGHTWLRLGVRGGTAFDIRVTTAGTDVHASLGAAVPSASWRLVWALSTLKTPDERVAVEGFYDGMLPVTEADLETLRDFPYEEEAMRKKIGFSEFLGGATGLELKKRIYMYPAVSISAMEAGEPHNGPRGIVPHTAWARVSFYLVADQDPEKLEGLLRRHFDKHGFPDVEVTRREAINRPIRTPVDTPFRTRALACAREVYDKPMVVELTQLGGGPAGILRDARPDLPVVGFGPGNTAGNHHAPDENLKIDDYVRAVKYLIALFYSY